MINKIVGATLGRLGKLFNDRPNRLGKTRTFEYEGTHELWVEVNDKDEIEIYVASVNARLTGKSLDAAKKTIKDAYDKLAKVAGSQPGGRTPEQKKQKQENRAKLLKELESTIHLQLAKLIEGMQKPHERLKDVRGYVIDQKFEAANPKLAKEGINLVELLEGLLKPKDPDEAKFKALLQKYEKDNGGDALGHQYFQGQSVPTPDLAIQGYLNNAKKTNHDVTIHAHHIVMRKGPSATYDRVTDGSATPVQESQQILKDVKIDPINGPENLMWAPNWSHTKKYALAVYKELKATPKNKIDIINKLKDLGDRFAKGEFKSP